MTNMFRGATSFNQNMNHGISNVITMENMFNEALESNQNIRTWIVNDETVLTNMFNGATAFQNKYNVENDESFPSSSFFNRVKISVHSNGKTLVTDNPETVDAGTVMTDDGDNYLVVSDGSNGSSGIKDYDTSTFKYTVDGIEYDMQHIITTKVTDMSELFKEKTEFNEDIGSWDTSNVTNMKFMFIMIRIHKIHIYLIKI